MPTYLIYLAFLFFELLIAFFLAFYTSSLLLSSFMGAPYVPSKDKEFVETLRLAKLKKGQLFVELGSGDGRVVKEAVKKYHVRGIGIDINPFLILLSKLTTKLQKINNIDFKLANIYKYNLSKADVIYIFLMPEMIEKLIPKFNKEINDNCLLISHGFKLPSWDQYLAKTVNRPIFSSYFYKKNV